MTLRSDYAALASSSFGRNAALYGRERDRSNMPRIAVAGAPAIAMPREKRIHVGDNAAAHMIMAPGLAATVARGLGNRGTAARPNPDAPNLSFGEDEVKHILGAKALKDAVPPEVYFSLESDVATLVANNGSVALTLTNNTRDVWLLNFGTDDNMIGWYFSSWTIGMEINRIQQGEVSAQKWAMRLNQQLSQPKSKRWNRQDTILATAWNRTGAPAFFRMSVDARYVSPPCDT